jgi:alpha/beta superfamily hydrolase
MKTAEEDKLGMREARRLFDVEAMAKQSTTKMYQQAGEAQTLEARHFFLNQVKRIEKHLAQILAA